MGNFTILSLSGGDYMGLYTAHVLAALEARSGKPLRESFDLVAGTSIGGIIGLTIARGIPMAQLVERFEARGVEIFSGRPPPDGFASTARDMLRFLTGSKYSNAALRSTILEMIDGDILLGDLEARYIAPTVNLTRGKPMTFRTPHLKHHSNSAHIRAIDVALATSAAPTILPLVEIGGEYYCDGGIYANSPDHIAMHEAESLIGIDPDTVSMLSIGTTSAAYEFPTPKSPSFGLREWLDERRIIRMALATQQQSAHRILQHRLGERYLRLDAVQGPDHTPCLGLDVATPEARHILRSLAGDTAHSLEDVAGLDSILAHCAPRPSFYETPASPEPDPVTTDAKVTGLLGGRFRE
jgi:patatin-like phospholipase/acyl hydrolase